jgi:lipopolysaccharide transport system permease protein
VKVEIPGTQTWTKVIESRRSLVDLRLGELWRYRHLIKIFVRRDFVAAYKQTILGPFWMIFPSLVSTVVFTIVFGQVAQIPTDGIPHIVFYMAGIITWNYFSTCVISGAGVFTSQAGLFSKIYFPRLTVPIGNMISTFISSLAQLATFIAFILYYWIKGQIVGPNAAVLLVPVLYIMMSMFALGVGSILSALTVKYRDLSFLVQFGIQLWMYATTIIYPLSAVPEKYRIIALLNPMSSIIETFRYAWIGQGSVPVDGLVIAGIASLGSFVVGVVVFNFAERTAMDMV